MSAPVDTSPREHGIVIRENMVYLLGFGLGLALGFGLGFRLGLTSRLRLGLGGRFRRILLCS